MTESNKLIIIKNEEAGLRKGDILEVTQTAGNVALLRIAHRPKVETPIPDLPADTLGIHVADGIGVEDKVE